MIETPEYAQMMRRMVRAYGRRVAEADPVDLAEMIALRAELEDAISVAVRAQADSWSWATVAAALRVSPQAAWKRCEWCGQAGGHENGCRLGLGPDERGTHRTDCNCAPPYADCRHPACDCTECVYDCPGPCGDHEWLDRPESDTRECLICGVEEAGLL